MTRRKLFEWTVHGIGVLTAGVLAVPALLTVLSPALRTRRGPRWHPLGEWEALPVGRMTRAVVKPAAGPGEGLTVPEAVFVLRIDERQVVVFSRNCTDLSCPLTWDEGSECFLCPCHGGIFSKLGIPMAGPPSRPMYRYATRVRRGVLEIDLRSGPAIA